MPKKIDWLYHRKGCTTCKKAEAFRDDAEVKVGEVIDAVKIRFGESDALALLDGMTKLVAAKGKKIDTIDLKTDRPDDATLLKFLMGPTGNLRAPTAKVGKTLLVGFNEESYAAVIGS
jgi:arsenate reductase-like glutaredoxin family protein